MVVKILRNRLREIYEDKRIAHLISNILRVPCDFCGNTLIEEQKPKPCIIKYYRNKLGGVYAVEYRLNLTEPTHPPIKFNHNVDEDDLVKEDTVENDSLNSRIEEL